MSDFRNVKHFEIFLQKLNYLIVGDKPTKRKVESAKELNVKILSQEEWFKMLNITS